MKIATIEFTEIVKGMYISEDKKGLVVEILDPTGLDKNVELGALSVEVTLKIEECVQGYADKIECIVFDNRKYWELDLGDGFVLDLEALCSIFHNLKTVACGGGEFTTTDYPNELRLMSGWDFCDLARTAYRNGDLKKAEYYYQWAEITDFYDCMHTCGVWLEENGRYDEAEAHFKMISGEKDKYGAVNNSYAVLLDKLGRSVEAQEYLRYVLYRRTYKDAREFAEVFLYEQCQDEDSPYWQNLCLEELNNRLRDYIDACKENGKIPDIERILLNASNSEKQCFDGDAMTKLMQIYGTGKYAFEYGDIIDVPGFPDFDKFKELASETYESPILRAMYLDFVENWECERVGELNNEEVKIFEEALLTIDVGRQILFWLYYNGEYEGFEVGSIEVPQLIDLRKAANLLDDDGVWCSILEYSNFLDNWQDDTKSVKLFEQAYALHPENIYVTSELLMYFAETSLERFIEVLKNASKECVNRLLEDYYEFFFDRLNSIELAEDLEKYVLSLIETGYKFELQENYFVDTIKDEMLAIYQRGAGFEYIEHEFPSLINIEKATAFAQKYNLELFNFDDEYIDEDEE